MQTDRGTPEGTWLDDVLDAASHRYQQMPTTAREVTTMQSTAEPIPLRVQALALMDTLECEGLPIRAEVVRELIRRLFPDEDAL